MKMKGGFMYLFNNRVALRIIVIALCLAIFVLSSQLYKANSEKHKLENENKEMSDQINELRNKNKQIKDKLKNKTNKIDEIINENEELKEEIEKKDGEIKKLKETKNKTMTMRLTHYTMYCDGCTGRTASGYKLSHGQTKYNGYVIVAADTSILPLHSKIKIINPDGNSFKAIVLDRGGAIKGSRLDVLTATKEEAYRKGVYNAQVEVLSYGDNEYRKVN